MEEEKRKETYCELLEEKEAFLEAHRFSREARGLYYLGALMYQIGEAQRYQDHETKPILNKVRYTGMSRTEVLQLYEELLEKMQQYKRVMISRKLEFKAEKYYAMAARYLTMDEAAPLKDERMNLFYIMCGYGNCINVNASEKKEAEEDVKEQP